MIWRERTQYPGDLFDGLLKIPAMDMVEQGKAVTGNGISTAL